uniref:WD_REPEATS_REGION domain-containing protein n=1 Tax=Macrostomum lignano TaxID=282301 RepID=A0A1I8FBR2_9PLAT
RRQRLCERRGCRRVRQSERRTAVPVTPPQLPRPPLWPQTVSAARKEAPSRQSDTAGWRIGGLLASRTQPNSTGGRRRQSRPPPPVPYPPPLSAADLSPGFGGPPPLGMQNPFHRPPLHQSALNSQILLQPNASVPARIRSGQRYAKRAYSFLITESGGMQPAPFPPDAMVGPGGAAPRQQISSLPHGEVVCAVTISNPCRHVFTAARAACGTSAPVEAAPVHSLDCLQRDNYIRSVKLLQDGRTLIVGGEASTLTIWIWHRRRPESKASWPAGARLLRPGRVTRQQAVLQLLLRRHIAVSRATLDGASCVDITPDGNRLWTGGLDNTVRCWELRESCELQKYDFSSQIFSLGDWLAVGMESSTVEVLNVNKPEKYQLHLHDSCVLSLKFRRLRQVVLFNRQGQPAQRLENPLTCQYFSEASSVLSCDISADDRYIVTGSGDKRRLSTKLPTAEAAAHGPSRHLPFQLWLNTVDEMP